MFFFLPRSSSAADHFAMSGDIQGCVVFIHMGHILLKLYSINVLHFVLWKLSTIYWVKKKKKIILQKKKLYTEIKKKYGFWFICNIFFQNKCGINYGLDRWKKVMVDSSMFLY